jgi:hypothetical protein
MTPHRLIGVVFLLCAGTPLFALIQKPSFSGTWIIQEPAKGAGQEQVIKQDDKSIAITFGKRTRTHELNGVEKKEMMAMRGGEIVMVSKAAWEGNTIVITTTTNYPNQMTTLDREVWSIDAQGRLVIDLTGTAVNQPNSAPSVQKIVLTKKN